MLIVVKNYKQNQTRPCLFKNKCRVCYNGKACNKSMFLRIDTTTKHVFLQYNHSH